MPDQLSRRFFLSIVPAVLASQAANACGDGKVGTADDNFTNFTTSDGKTVSWSINLDHQGKALDLIVASIKNKDGSFAFSGPAIVIFDNPLNQKPPFGFNVPIISVSGLRRNPNDTLGFNHTSCIVLGWEFLQPTIQNLINNEPDLKAAGLDKLKVYATKEEADAALPAPSAVQILPLGRPAYSPPVTLRR